MTGTIDQVSISAGGVPNHAIEEGVVTIRGISGDGWRYPFHGGPKRAILLVTSEGITSLVDQGFPLYHGALGENLTTRGLDRSLLRLGRRLRAGGVVIELTQVRIPCDTLSVYGAGIQAALYDARASRRCGIARLGAQRILRVGSGTWHLAAGRCNRSAGVMNDEEGWSARARSAGEVLGRRSPSRACSSRTGAV